MKLDSLRTLWIEEMRDLYNAENQLLKALPKMAKKATTPELKEAFESHLGKREHMRSGSSKSSSSSLRSPAVRPAKR